MSDSSEEIYLRAGEYVLGLLDADDMAQVRRDAAANAALVDAIGFWERRLAPLAAFVPAVAPPGWLWERIETRLGAAAAAPAAQSAEVIPFRPRGSLRVWQGAAVASLAVAAALAVALFRPQSPPQYFAVLPNNAAATAGFLAHVRSDGSIKLTALGSIIQPSQRDLWLWVVDKSGPVPVSALSANGNYTLPRGVVPDAVAAVAVSDEAHGITPTKPGTIDYIGAKLVVPE